MPVYVNPDFRRLPPVLDRIFAGQRRGSLFQAARWYDVLSRTAAPQGTEVRVYTSETPGTETALLLQTAADGSRRSLVSLSNFYSIEHDVVAIAGADLERGSAAIIAEIDAERPRWDHLRLGEFDPAHPSYEILRKALRKANWLVECAPGPGTWYEDTEELGFADYLAARPPELRNTWRRKRRALDRGGTLRAAFYPGGLEIEEAVAGYQDVYALSWKEPEPFAEFMPTLIRLGAELGALRLGIYYIADKPAAAQVWLLWDGRAAIYKLAHDRELDALSLGTLLTMEMFERVLQQDHPAEINLGRGDDPYKKLWLPRRRERWSIHACNPRTAAGLARGLRGELAKLYHRVQRRPMTPA